MCKKILRNWHGLKFWYDKEVEGIDECRILKKDDCSKILGYSLMQKIYINSWLNKQGSIAFVPNLENELELDFSNVDEIRLQDIESLLTLQKLAVFNEMKIRVQNMQPAITRVFEQTGLYKMMNTLGTPVKLKIRKRQGLAFD